MHAIGSLPHLGGSELSGLLQHSETIPDLEKAFERVSEYSQHARQNLPVPDGELLTMPADGPEGLGVKLLTLNPGNPGRGMPLIHGVYIMFAPGTLAAEATLDGGALTAVRTAAVSAVATRHLARPDARRLVVFGAGVQAAAHIAAMCAVRPIEHVAIVGTGSKRTHELRESVLSNGLACELGRPADVASADIICTCTTSATPLFAGEWPAPGTHINAIGAYRPDTRELDGPLIASAQVVVETRAAALAEAGDVIQAISEGMCDAADLVELQDLVCGKVQRHDQAAVTIFKSVGIPFEDLVVARTAIRRLAADSAGAQAGIDSAHA
jgi:ornithine cyclodeaminase/alanine dehydrogenase-like protein (mu-crystallin family)